MQKSGLEHIEYVPTQILTEYFRHLYLDPARDRVWGIIYPSAANLGHKSCVLFLENEHCCDPDKLNAGSDYRLLLERVRRRSIQSSLASA